MQLFDIHCHILPGVDDGSQDLETSMEMLRIAYEDGTREILLTPHYMLGRNKYTYADLDEKFEMLKAEDEEPNDNEEPDEDSEDGPVSDIIQDANDIIWGNVDEEEYIDRLNELFLEVNNTSWECFPCHHEGKFNHL